MDEVIFFMMNETRELDECYNIINQLEKMNDNHLTANLLKSLVKKYPVTRKSVLNYSIFDNID